MPRDSEGTGRWRSYPLTFSYHLLLGPRGTAEAGPVAGPFMVVASNFPLKEGSMFEDRWH